MDEIKVNSVLVVDDESSNILALTHILNPTYTVYAAKNGRDAIKAVEKYLPDVILLDIIMPDMDGYAVIAELKSNEKTKGIPVIFITGLSSADDEEKGLALGAADYISKPFSSAIVKLRIRNQIAMLNQLRIIERLSMIDQLTDLPNRRNCELRLETEWNRAMRERMPLSALMIDVDRFKVYNDTYGHPQGDLALQTLAKILTQELKRGGDFAARWGGEEFLVLLPNTNMIGALGVAENIRALVESAEIPGLGGQSATTTMTVSVGANTWTQEPGGKNEFVSGADMALYAAKEKGRNQVCHFRDTERNGPL